MGAGDISQDMLSDMGLGDMQTMSDSQGMDVRGMGYAYASVSGFVSVHVPGVYIFEKKYASDRGYSASAMGGFTVKIQSNYSYLYVSEVGFAVAGH